MEVCEETRMVVTSFKAPKCLIDLLDAIAKEKGVTRSELIRQAIAEIVKRNMMKPAPFKVVRIWS